MKKAASKLGAFVKWIIGSLVLSLIVGGGVRLFSDGMSPKALYFHDTGDGVVEEIQVKGKMNSVSDVRYLLYYDLTDFSPEEKENANRYLDSEYGYVSQYNGFSYSRTPLSGHQDVLKVEIHLDPAKAASYNIKTVLEDVMGLTYDGYDFSEVSMESWKNGLQSVGMTQGKKALTEQDVLSALGLR